MSAFIVAEAGCNHLGDRKKMLAFCDAAKACGADAVKFQAYNTDALITRRGIAANAMLDRYNVQDLLRLSELTDADLDAIAAHCKAIGFKHFYSVFDPSQVERVLSRGACALKIGHKENNWRELIHACIYEREFTPLYVSVAGKWPEELDGDWTALRTVVCTPEYPATSPPHLRLVKNGHSGFSSHYTDYRIPAAAALRGAEYIEFHVRLSDDDPEAAWSLSIEDATKCCKLIREYESWL